jgi:hypothetical protein
LTWSITAGTPGPHEVCAYAINKNAGNDNTRIGCHTVNVPEALWNPLGSLDSATVSGRAVTLSGWALDLDLPVDPVKVHLYVNGRWGGEITANATRVDVGNAFPGTGSEHGFKTTLELAGGQHQICAYVINTGFGSANSEAGCRTVSVSPAAWNPFGSFDGVSATDRVLTVSGWLIDPDIPRSPATVHVYVDGAWGGLQAASVNRTDVGNAFPWAGPAHGYALKIPVPAGRHEVCVYAINAGAGNANPLLACRTVTA